MRKIFKGFIEGLASMLAPSALTWPKTPTVKWRKCESRERSYFLINDAPPAHITFYPCGVTSYSPGDIQHRYCHYCGRWL